MKGRKGSDPDTISWGGVATWTYDDAGRPTGATVNHPSSPLLRLAWDYDAAGQVSQRRLTSSGTGAVTITTDYGYTDAGQVNKVETYTPVRKIETVTYIYDLASGAVTDITRKAWRTEGDPYLDAVYLPPDNPPPANETYQTNPTFSSRVTLAYDVKGQMTQYGSTFFSWDGQGNPTESGVQIGAGNRLLADSVWNYRFDKEGNLIHKEGASNGQVWDYTFDHLNRLTHAEETTSYLGTTYTLASITYDYDGLGRRVQSHVQTWSLTTLTSDTTRRTVFDGGTLLADLNSSNALQTRYVMDPTTAAPVARIDPSGTPQVCWYVTDKDGAVLDLVDDQGRMRKRLKESGFKTEDVLTVSGTPTGWVPNSDGTWTWVSWTPSATVSDRMTLAGQEYDATTSLLFTGGRYYDQDQKRYIGEEPGGLEGQNAYRYPRNSPSNLKPTKRKARDPFEAQVDFFAGVADTLTLGLTSKLRQTLDIDAVNYDSAMYTVGSHVGHAINTALMFVNPASVGGALGEALGVMNKVQEAVGLVQGVQALAEGRIWDAAQSFAGMGLAGLRGRSPCSWRSAIAGWGQRGLHAISVGQNLGAAWQALQEGDVLGALVDLADAGANAYRFQQACFAAGTPLLWEFGSKAIEQFVVGDRLWSRDEFDPHGPLVLKIVEEVFVRTARIWHLHVGGQVIRTTAEHPVFVKRAWDWVAVQELRPGDLLLSHDGQWVAVEEVYDSGEYETVYNLRVADFHTYFVGSSTDWGFSVWAHNNGGPCGKYDANAAKAFLGEIRAGEKVVLQGSGGKGKVYYMTKTRLKSKKPYIGSTKREVGTGRRGYDRLEDADHRAKTTDKKAPKGRVIAENLTRKEMLGIEGILVQVGGGKLSNGQKAIDVSLPKNKKRVEAGDKVITKWYKKFQQQQG